MIKWNLFSGFKCASIYKSQCNIPHDIMKGKKLTYSPQFMQKNI